MLIRDKVMGMVGLCAKAGRLQSGYDACMNALKRGKAQLILVDSGASDNTRKAMNDACLFRKVQIRELPERALGTTIGKPGRMTAVVIDEKFASNIIELVDQQRDCGGAYR
ncbi:MAG: ribosomal L7Ae/L30e/S12e/Gadd45 family protein [Clostridia bacterium]|nr:ribosomal L7Ae/L30e/S12e/Gadd45 family protein [Clostridia bacterium]